jgi:aryl-alcohol dehydrogenase-like predicted oxidoreductase
MALEGLTREGKIRHVGVSNYDVKQMEELAHAGAVETLQSPCRSQWQTSRVSGPTAQLARSPGWHAEPSRGATPCRGALGS